MVSVYSLTGTLYHARNLDFGSHVGYDMTADVCLSDQCSAILPTDWPAEPCPNDAYVEELSPQRPVASGPVNL